MDSPEIVVVLEDPPPDIVVVLESATPEILVTVSDIGEKGDPGQDGSGGEELLIALDEHVNSPSPHPVYDDGPSFLLSYQNAKV